MNHRYIARIVLESTTPLFVGSGESSLIKDALVMKDVNGFPMIPGTAITGVLRHALPLTEKEKDAIFGFEEEKSKNGEGSRLRISSAYFVLGDGTVSQGLMDTAAHQNILDRLEELPKRQHVRINDRGAAEKGGLFDNEVVYKGGRFVFEMELIGTEADHDDWEKINNELKKPGFRLGGGTRNGYGGFKVYVLENIPYDLSSEAGFDGYLTRDTAFPNVSIPSAGHQNNACTYQLDLKPDSFFLFGGNFGDEEVDNKPLEEDVMVYENGAIHFAKHTVIPASSIKGALAHRTAFHYNKLKGRFIDSLSGHLSRPVINQLYTGSGNKAVNELFGLGMGFGWDNATQQQIDQGYSDYDDYGDYRRGHVVIDDLYFDENAVTNDKIFNHVAIDRFTGGAMDSALFSEKVSRLEEGDIKLNIYLDKEFEDVEVIHAFENALLDITRGLLPLGGMTTKGHGIFTGRLTRDAEEINKYHVKNEQS